MKNFFLFALIFVLALFLSCSQPALDKNDNEQTINNSNEEINDVNELDLLLNQYDIPYDTQISQCLQTAGSINPEEVVQQLYDYFFAANIEGMLNLLSDDIVWIHLGPSNPLLPNYNTFYGKDGFLQWVEALVGNMSMNVFDLHYIIGDGNRVDSHVLEGATMFLSGSQVNIENFHTFKINNEGKIEYALIISESDTVVKSLGGSTGEVFETEYKTDDYQSNCQYDERIIKKIALLAAYLIKSGHINLLNKFLSNDIEVATSGSESLVPFFGKFNGKKGIREFSQKFSKEINSLSLKYIIASANKVNVHCIIKGRSSITNENYQSDYALCFQFNDRGKIVKLYSYCNTNLVVEAYR